MEGSAEHPVGRGAEGKREGKDHFKIRDLLADGRCSQAVSEWERRERREREEERRAEAEELGAAAELAREVPLFLPTPSFMASADEV